MDSTSQFVDEEDGVAERSPDGRYIRYDETLGFGSFKVVYKGFDEIEGMEIAWNKITVGDDIALRDRALSEATLAKSLKHKNVMRCHCYWFDREEKSVNMITELFTSGSLRKFRQQHKQVELKAIKNWARQILRGLCYLHTLDPPIVHRDLKCDNLFISASSGEVKIGDFGFATSLQHESARTVSGTPEFMAPEMLEGEYDELVDVYAFGMCVLELVSCEYPYSECTTLGQIYKKVLTGVKPAALGEVKDLQVREFIEKCLAPASQRLSALELLNDPFLSCGKPEEKIVRQPCNIMPKVENVPRPEPQISIDRVSDVGHLSNGRIYPSSLLHCRFDQGKEYKLKGKRVDRNHISFSLWITALRRDTFSFTFDLESDTALSVAREMAELELDQAKFGINDVVPVTELMDNMILELVTTWKPSKLNRVEFSHDKVTTFGRGGFSNQSRVSFVHSLIADGSDSDSSMSSASPVAATAGDKDDGELKLEFEATDSHLSHCWQQLLMEAKTMGTAKERWTSYRPRMGFV